MPLPYPNTHQPHNRLPEECRKRYRAEAAAEEQARQEKAKQEKAQADRLAKAQAACKLNVAAGAKNVPIQLKKKNNKIMAISLADGDALASAQSDNEKFVKASISGNKVVLRGMKANKKATITVKTAIGAVITFSVKVQKKVVKTKKITAPKKIKVKIGEKVDLGAIITPVTTLDKLSFTSSGKKIASVGKKNGLITGKKPGTVKITIRSGNKKKVVSVTVEK